MATTRWEEIIVSRSKLREPFLGHERRCMLATHGEPRPSVMPSEVSGVHDVSPGHHFQTCAPMLETLLQRPLHGRLL